MRIRVGIVGVSGYGGGRGPPADRVASQFRAHLRRRRKLRRPEAGKTVPWRAAHSENSSSKMGPGRPAEDLDVLFASLPTGESEALGAGSAEHQDRRHRRRPPLRRGLDLRPGRRLAGRDHGKRPASPTPAATPPPRSPPSRRSSPSKLIEPTNIIIDAKTGVSGAGRGRRRCDVRLRRGERGRHRVRPAQARARAGDDRRRSRSSPARRRQV